MLRDITVVVPLKDRAYETATFIRHSVKSGIRFLFLDGSADDQNKAIVQPSLCSDLQYERFAPDLNMDMYVQKMASGLRMVRTPYVMMADNDDVVVVQGLAEAAKVLASDSRSVFAGGDIVGFLRSLSRGERVTWPKTNVNTSRLDGMEGIDAVNESRLDWRHTWYSVFRTDVLSWCWDQILQSRVRDPYLVEFLICDLPFSKGRYSYSRAPHYMRLQNQTDRAIAGLGFKSVELGRQPKSWWKESDEGDEILASHLGVAPSRLESQFHRAAAVASLRSSSVRPAGFVKDLQVRVADGFPFLSLETAVRLTASGRFRLIPIQDSSGR